VDRCHPLLSPTLKISDNLRGPQRLLVTLGMDIKLLESSILRIRRPVLYPLSYGCLAPFHILNGVQLQGRPPSALFQRTVAEDEDCVQRKSAWDLSCSVERRFE
jgi:hypothetical protein